jgi:hypothetical protein
VPSGSASGNPPAAPAGPDYIRVRGVEDTVAFHAEIRRLYDYWRAIAPAGRLPGRIHFDPLDIPSLLPRIWLLDVQRAPLRYRFRVAGTFLVQFQGFDPTGRWYDEAFAGRPIAGVLERFGSAAEERIPVWRRGPAVVAPQSEWRRIETLVLPLATDGEHVDMILGATVVHTAQGST